MSVSALTPPSARTRADGEPEDAGETSRFEPGFVFANRYRMITLIGRGAMGEVWQADDLMLQTAVALKLIEASDEDGRERILKEVRLARQITDAAVCRVFDVGESDGVVFYSMELVEGEDVATLLRRIGRLPSEKVVEIGEQLCGGLAAAHAAGVLHRDLKPANILIDGDGLVRITDFGIAVTRGDPGYEMVAGTPGYMAPEQRAGLPLSERTDLYALGVVLYELLAGKLPFPQGAAAGSPPVRPSALVADVNPALERLILEALSPDPHARPASAADMAERLRYGVQARPRPGRWPAWAGMVAVGAVLAVAAAIVIVVRGSGGPGATDTLVVADFVNTTGEPVFDRALEVALAVALEQSPFLRVFPDERARETLRLLERPPDEGMTRAVAREVARREQLKALVAGSIGSFGEHYVLTIEAINAETGDVVAREQVEVPEKEQVLRSLGSAAARLREQLGESLASVQRFDVPLPRATTASLEALHAYALALDEGRLNPRREAIPHLRRALELDPGFAMAQALLSAVYANTGETATAPEYSKKAFDLRDRVSERERFFISWRYYVDAIQAWDKALALAESWTTTYPREAFAFNSLGIASAAFGQHERAVLAFRKAIDADPGFVPPYGNLVGSLIALDRFDEAGVALREARTRGIDGIALQRAAFMLPFLKGNEAAMADALTAAQSSSSVAGASIWEARAAAFAGRFARAHGLFARGIRSVRDQSLPEVAAQWTVEDAELYAIAARCERAMSGVSDALALSRDNFTLERASRIAALCSEDDVYSTLTSELASRFADAALTVRLQLPVAAASRALRRGDTMEALALLGPVRPYDHAPAAEFWPAYLRGHAYLQARDGAAARAEFQRILDHRGEAPTSPLYALATLGLARTALLEGNTAASTTALASFGAAWKDGDPDLPPRNARWRLFDQAAAAAPR